MTDEVLEKLFERAVASERKITRQILTYISQLEDRKIHLKRGCGSMYGYLIKVHKYSSGAASRRVAAASVLRAVPEVGEKVQSGAVNLSSLCQAQVIMKKSKLDISDEQKAEVVTHIENKVGDEVERTLFELFPEAGSSKQESLKRVSENTSRLSMDIPDQLRENLERLKELFAHSMPSATNAELLLKSTEELLNQVDPLRKPQAKPQEAKDVTPAMKKFIRQRDNDECQWEDALTKRKCRSRYRVEVDHIILRAQGGSNEVENLRCLCRQHNQFHAEQKLGKARANQWRQENRE